MDVAIICIHEIFDAPRASLPPWNGSTFRSPKKLLQALLFGEQPLFDIDLIMPYLSHLSIQPVNCNGSHGRNT